MTPHLLVFGRTPLFAYEEAKALIPGIRLIHPSVALVDLASDSVPSDLIASLGGTVKVSRVLGDIPSITADQLLPFFPHDQTHLTFAVSMVGSSAFVPPGVLSTLKEQLQKQGVVARYLKPKDNESELRSVVISKEHVFELLVLPIEQSFLVASTQAVQPFEEWSKRDSGRPYIDAKAGMLPPKVARMAVNVVAIPKASGQIHLLDPFCGMGTILAEGLLTGWNVIGSDVLPQVVDKAKKNLQWLCLQKGIDTRKFILFCSDAVHVSGTVPPKSIDAIVTEPFMGTPLLGEGKVDPQKVPDIVKGLEKLYIGCLRDWRGVLKDGGKLCIAFPTITQGTRQITVKKVIDTCENLGYTKLLGPIAYGREHAVVRRDFYIFQKV